MKAAENYPNPLVVTIVSITVKIGMQLSLVSLIMRKFPFFTLKRMALILVHAQTSLQFPIRKTNSRLSVSPKTCFIDGGLRKTITYKQNSSVYCDQVANDFQQFRKVLSYYFFEYFLSPFFFLEKSLLNWPQNCLCFFMSWFFSHKPAPTHQLCTGSQSPSLWTTRGVPPFPHFCCLLKEF